MLAGQADDSLNDLFPGHNARIVRGIGDDDITSPRYILVAG